MSHFTNISDQSQSCAENETPKNGAGGLINTGCCSLDQVRQIENAGPYNTMNISMVILNNFG